MSSITQQPDTVSFARNLKKFIVSSEAEVSFRLLKGDDLILDEIYQPMNGVVEINISEVVDKLLSVSFPSAPITDQVDAICQFTATIDGADIAFTAIKGGVAELDETAEAFTNDHFLSWQIQDKKILQSQPEWLTLYTNGSRILKVKAYFQDKTDETITLHTLNNTGKLYTINVSWATVNAALIKKNPVVWEVWFEDTNGIRLSYIQRFTLRNPSEEENVFIWFNRLGGIDSFSFKGYKEDDRNLEHLIGENYDDSFEEYYIDYRKREIKQSTGYLTKSESRWIDDFFLSMKRYKVESDGTVKAIVFTESKNVKATIDDLHSFEFTYRYASETDLLNLDRTFDPLPAPEGLDDFFLTELLAGLTAAGYSDELIIAVQHPLSQGWMKLTMAQLWQAFGLNALLPLFKLDRNTLKLNYDPLKLAIVDGALTLVGGMDSGTLQELKDYINSIVNNNGQPATDSKSEIMEGVITWISGLTYRSSIYKYKIYGVSYTANAKEFTLEAANPTLSRIDTFYVDTFGNMNVKKGTPAVDPTAPLLSSSQLAVMSVLIKPAAVEPDGIESEKVYDEHLEWTASESHDQYVTVDFDSTENPKSGKKRIKVGIDVPDTVVNAPLHYIGEKYKEGIIFWIDPASNGKNGLIVAENDSSASVVWERLTGYSVYQTGANGVLIGTGKANTDLMLASEAARGWAVATVNTAAGRFMPSEKELAEIWTRRDKIPNLGTKTYWSSTEVTGSDNWKRARCIAFGTGAPYTRDKNNAYAVREIWAFDDTQLPTGVPVETITPQATRLTFTKGMAFPVKDAFLSAEILSSVEWKGNTMLIIEAWLNGEVTGSVVITPASSLYGYNPGDDSWQFVAIGMSNFGCSKETVDAFSFALAGNWPNGIDLGIDNIRYQYVKKSAPVVKAEKDSSRLVNPVSRNVSVQFDQPFDTIPVGRRNLSVFRQAEVAPGKVVDQDVTFHSLTVTNTGFTLVIDEDEDLSGITIEWDFKKATTQGATVYALVRMDSTLIAADNAVITI